MQVRIGNISQGKMKCDGCQRTIPYAGRYLIVNEKDGVETEEGGEAKHYCVTCAVDKGYGYYREEKGNRVLTFFTEAIKPLTPPVDQEQASE
jgi:hypothetical protein